MCTWYIYTNLTDKSVLKGCCKILAKKERDIKNKLKKKINIIIIFI